MPNEDMARNLEDINKVRVANGMAPLDKLPENGSAGAGNEDNKNGGENETTNDAPENTEDTKGQGNKGKGNEGEGAGEAEIDDAKLLQALQKRGINLTSVEELKPKEDPAVVAEKREAAKLSFGLSKGKFSKKLYEQFITDTANPQNIVYHQYYAEAKKADPELTDEQVMAEFEERYGLNENPDSWKFKRGAQEIGLLADKILKAAYAPIYNLDSEFDSFEKEQAERLSAQEKVKTKAHLYKKDIEDLFASDLKKISIVEEGEQFDIDVPQDILDELKPMFLDADYAAGQIVKGWDKNKIKEVALATMRNQYFQQFSFQVAKQYLLKHQAGTKGIPQGGQAERKGKRTLTENQKKILQEQGISEDSLPTEN